MEVIEQLISEADKELFAKAHWKIALVGQTVLIGETHIYNEPIRGLGRRFSELMNGCKVFFLEFDPSTSVWPGRSEYPTPMMVAKPPVKFLEEKGKAAPDIIYLDKTVKEGRTIPQNAELFRRAGVNLTDAEYGMLHLFYLGYSEYLRGSHLDLFFSNIITYPDFGITDDVKFKILELYKQFKDYPDSLIPYFVATFQKLDETVREVSMQQTIADNYERLNEPAYMVVGVGHFEGISETLKDKDFRTDINSSITGIIVNTMHDIPNEIAKLKQMHSQS